MYCGKHCLYCFGEHHSTRFALGSIAEPKFILKSSETSPPSGVTAVQDGLTSITMTWTTSSDATGYRIYYSSSGGDSGLADISNGHSDHHTLSSLGREDTYTISIIATSQKLPASRPITVKVTLCEDYNF